MVKNPNQPSAYDAVLGGHNPPPVGTVLGGIEGVKWRLASASISQRIAALEEALKYGEEGLNLVILALLDPSSELQWAALKLLRERTEPRVIKALQEYPFPLVSALGVDYTRLRDLLASQKWKEADRETAFAMLFPLVSAMGIDYNHYTQLCNRLISNDEQTWAEANKEIRQVIVKLSDGGGGISTEELKKFPCVDLRTIDHLWVQHSNGRFGFSVQKRIWQSVSVQGWEDYKSFCLAVGWCRERVNKGPWWFSWDDLTFNTTARQGHLPAFRAKRGYWWGMGREETLEWFNVLFSCAETCKL